MHRKTTGVVAVVLALGGSLALAGGEKGTKALQGSWKPAEAKPPVASLAFDGDKFTLKFTDGKVASGTYKIDTSKKPKTIDMLVTGGSEEVLGKFKEKTALAIYEVSGDKLKWCSNMPGAAERPKMFGADEIAAVGGLYIIFDRVKK